MASRSRTGDDPTRTHPAGSRTETKIAEESELGSDGAGGSEVGDRENRPVKPARPHKRRGTAKR
jgi:hypothetical protein